MTSPSARLNSSDISLTTPTSSPEKYWPSVKCKVAKTTPIKHSPNAFDVATPSSASLAKMRQQAQIEEALNQHLAAYNHEASMKGLKGRKRTLSNLSSSSSSSDSDEEQNNEGEDRDNDDTSSSDSCSSTSSSGSDSSESSSDSSDCDDNDEDNDDDDYDSENSESKSNVLLAQIYKKQKCESLLSASSPMSKHLSLVQPQKEEEWGFAAVAKSHPDIFAASSNSNSGTAKNNDMIKNLKPVKRKLTDHFTNIAKQESNQIEPIEQFTAAPSPSLAVQEVKASKEKSLPANASATVAPAVATTTEQKPTMTIKYKPKTLADGTNAKASNEQPTPPVQKKVVLLKSMPLEKKPTPQVRAEQEEDDEIPYLSQTNVIKYKLLEDISVAKGQEKPETPPPKEPEEKHPWEVKVDENPFDSQPLPNGVSQSDFDIYKQIRDRARRAIAGAMESPSKLISKPSFVHSNEERCPGSIEIGKWHIETWYSSPFPQEYARYVRHSHDVFFLFISQPFFYLFPG